MDSVLKSKKSLEEKRVELQNKAKLLKEQERRSNEKMMKEIGRIALSAQIEHLDKDVLLGAFLEIADKYKDNTAQKELWKQKSLQFYNNKKNINSGQPLVITFKNLPSIDVKETLKVNKFKWNSFRGEYYGYGDVELMKKLLNNIQCKIEVRE